MSVKTDVVCLIRSDAGGGTFTWSQGPASFAPYHLKGSLWEDFQEIAKEAREKLSDVVADWLHDPEAVAMSSFRLARSGHDLYRQLFDPGADEFHIANEVRQWLEHLRDQQAINSLEIVVDNNWSVPWNIVYDEKPNKAAFLEDKSKEVWRPFWGLRYNLCSGKRVNPLRRLPFLHNPEVLMVIDQEIRDGLPDQERMRLDAFIERHKLTVVSTRDDLQDVLADSRPDLLYWFSHATPDALHLGDDEITPSELRRWLRSSDIDNPYALGGLVFLNGCQTAEAGTAGSFFDSLCSVGFSGMIGTEQQTIDTFAAPLGLSFLEEFLENQRPVGALMRRLRASVPLGLLYGAYCPPMLFVSHEKADTADSIDIRTSNVSGGIALSGATSHGTGTQNLQRPGTAQLTELPENPYRSLAFYRNQDRSLFAGREMDVMRFSSVIDHADTRVVVLHGESGVGKSSFLQAGVIPYLEGECTGYRFLRGARSSAGDGLLFLRATNDVISQIADAICQFGAAPIEFDTPSGEHLTVDLPTILSECLACSLEPHAVRDQLNNDVTLLRRALSAISERLPFALVMVIDQCEEMITLATTEEDRQTYKRAMSIFRETIAGTGDYRIVLSLRTDYYGRIVDGLRQGVANLGGVREYLLTDFDKAALVDAIKRPTEKTFVPYSSQVPFDVYGFEYEEGLPERIAGDVLEFSSARTDSVLPLVQVICSQLYEMIRDRDDKRLTQQDYIDLKLKTHRQGSVEGGLQLHVDALIRRIVGNSRRGYQRVADLMTRLYVSQPDGSVTTALRFIDDLRNDWPHERKQPFDALVTEATDLRLLRLNSLRIGETREEKTYVSLGHDALASLANKWDQDKRWWLSLRKWAILGVTAVGLALLMLMLMISAVVAKRGAESARAAALTEKGKARAAEQDALAAEQDALSMLRQSRETVDGALTALARDLEFFPEAKNKLLERAVEQYRRMASRTYSDPLLKAEATRTRMRLGRAYLKSGELNEAGKTLDAAAQEWEALIGERKAITQLAQLAAGWRAEQAQTLVLSGEVAAANRETKKARQHFEKALKILELASDDVESAEETARDQLRSFILYLSANTAANLGKLVQSVEDLERAIKVYSEVESRAAAIEQKTEYALEKWNAADELGYQYQRSGRLQLALRTYETTLAELEKYQPNATAALEVKRRKTQMFLANLMQHVGQPEERERLCGEIATRLDELTGHYPDERLTRLLALNRANLGMVQVRWGKTEAGLEQLQMADEFFLESVLEIKLWLADAHLHRGQLAEAESALESCDTLIDSSNAYTQALLHIRRGRLRFVEAQGTDKPQDKNPEQFEKAVNELQLAQGELQSLLQGERAAVHHFTAAAWCDFYLANVLWSQGSKDKSLNLFSSSVKHWQTAVKMQGESLDHAQNLLWVIAVCPSSEFRNRAEYKKLLLKWSRQIAQQMTVPAAEKGAPPKSRPGSLWSAVALAQHRLGESADKALLAQAMSAMPTGGEGGLRSDIVRMVITRKADSAHLKQLGDRLHASLRGSMELPRLLGEVKKVEAGKSAQ